MPPSDPDLFVTWLKYLAYAAFAALGGFMGHLMRIIDENKKIVWSRAALEGIGAGFVGLLVLFACQALNLSEQWTGVIVGVCGWLGANASIRVLESVIFKKLGINPHTLTVEDPKDELSSTPDK